MQKAFIFFFKALKTLKSRIMSPIAWVATFCKFYIHGVDHSSFVTYGVPYINVSIGGIIRIGKHFRMNNTVASNPIGRVRPSSLVVGSNGQLIIGDNVGMSSSAIVCHNRIEIRSNAKLGGNVVIYDTDFHSVDAVDRMEGHIDRMNTMSKPVIIGENVFVGGHSTILKGVHIGKNSIIGACSLVTKSIPEYQLWAGNPAKFIRTLEDKSLGEK